MDAWCCAAGQCLNGLVMSDTPEDSGRVCRMSEKIYDYDNTSCFDMFGAS